MKKLRILSFFILAVLFLLNAILFFNRDPYSKNQLALFSLSPGDRYVARLNLWRLFIDNQRWDLADQQEKYLNPSDVADYKAKYHPSDLKKRLNNLVIKTPKTVDDYLEMAKLQVKLGKQTDAQNSLLAAKDLDPVRDDINSLFIDLQSR